MSRTRIGVNRSPAFAGLLLLLIVLAGGWFLANQYLRPLPEVAATPRIEAERTLGEAPALPWPTKGGAAVWMDGFGYLGIHGDETPRPIASTAKIMTALLVLEDHPLALGQPGPEVTITPQDVADYQKAVREDQSVVPVRAGDKLTELQLLQGLLLPSGNNIADVMAKWDGGTKEAFIAKMNAKAAALGMTRTHYDDASGFSPKTVSTPADLVIVGSRAMTDPVFRQTVAMAQITLPSVGVVKNVNSILGKDGNIGVKTGSTDEAGGCFVSASTQQVGGKPAEIYSAVLGQDELKNALEATTALSKAAAAAFRQTRVASRTDVVASLSSAWGDAVDVVPAQDLEVVVWPGTKLKSSLQLDPVKAPLGAGAKVGTLTLEVGKQSRQVSVVTAGPISEPSWQWRVTRFLRHQ